MQLPVSGGSESIDRYISASSKTVSFSLTLLSTLYMWKNKLFLFHFYIYKSYFEKNFKKFEESKTESFEMTSYKPHLATCKNFLVIIYTSIFPCLYDPIRHFVWSLLFFINFLWLNLLYLRSQFDYFRTIELIYFNQIVEFHNFFRQNKTKINTKTYKQKKTLNIPDKIPSAVRRYGNHVLDSLLCIPNHNFYENIS